MAKAYILNIKDTSGNWVGIPTLIGQKGEKGANGVKGVDGVGITNITQQDKKLIVDLSNNTRKEFTIPSADLPNGVDLLDKITREVPTNSSSITNFKTHLNIPSTTDIKTVKDLSFTDNKLKLTMNDESSKEVIIKSGGLELKTLFEGNIFLSEFSLNNIPTNWKYITITISSDDESMATIVGEKLNTATRRQVICDDAMNKWFTFRIEDNTLKGDKMIQLVSVIKVQVII